MDHILDHGHYLNVSLSLSFSQCMVSFIHPKNLMQCNSMRCDQLELGKDVKHFAQSKACFVRSAINHFYDSV